MEEPGMQPMSQIDVAQNNTELPKPGPGALFSAGYYGNHLEQHGKELSWLWEGYLAHGMTTLLTSQWKSGKTTLISILLSRLREGGNLAGQKVAPARAVILSEESPQLWRPRQKLLDLSHVYFFCRPFLTRPTFETWLAFIDHIADLQARENFQLFVIDTLASFLPGNCENNAVAVMNALEPLKKLSELGMALLYMHHPRKGFPLPGQAARGSGAFGACVDIIMEMSYYTHAGDLDRRRKLLAFGRHQATPGQCVIELNAEGTDYSVRGDFQEDEFTSNWNSVRLVLEDAAGKLTSEKILAAWPAEIPRPAPNTLWRWLRRAVALGLACRDGSGKCNEPFRYWLADKEAQWKQDPLYRFAQMYEEDQKTMEALLKNPRPLPPGLAG